MMMGVSSAMESDDEIGQAIAAMEEGRLASLKERQLQVSEFALIAHIKNKDFENFRAVYEEIERIHKPKQMRSLLGLQAESTRSNTESSNSLLSAVDQTQSQAQKTVAGQTAKKTLISFGCIAAAVLQYYAQSTGQHDASAPAPTPTAVPTAGSSAIPISSATSFTAPSYVILASIGLESAFAMVKQVIEHYQNNNLAQIRQLLKEQQDFYLAHQKDAEEVHQAPGSGVDAKPTSDEKPVVKKKRRRTKKKFKREAIMPN